MGATQGWRPTGRGKRSADVAIDRRTFHKRVDIDLREVEEATTFEKA